MAGVAGVLLVLVAGATAVRDRAIAARGAPCGCISEDLRFNCVPAHRGLV